jgi:hypothetical protein
MKGSMKDIVEVYRKDHQPTEPSNLEISLTANLSAVKDILRSNPDLETTTLRII